LRSLLDAHGLRLVAGFVPLVLHDAEQAEAARVTALRSARLLASAGGRVLVTAVVASSDWSPRAPLSAPELEHVVGMLAALEEIAGEHGLDHALHPHVGSLVETASDVGRVAEASSVRWCLDTGHLAIGGTEPSRFARELGDRVAHVHLKDVDLEVAARLGPGELSLREATREGLFRPLGRGDVAVDEVVGALEHSGYSGWYVLEQDAVLTQSVPSNGLPARAMEASIDHLRALAPALERERPGMGRAVLRPQRAGHEHEEDA
jgi:inosose dehydratase